MAKQFVVSMKIEGDASSLKAATGTARQAVNDLGRDVQTSASSLDAYGAAANQAAASERNLRAAIDQRLGIGAGRSSQQAAADVAAYGRELDALRAKYNPLYAAQQRYLAELADIRNAEKVGALGRAEAASAIGRTKTAFAAEVGTLKAAETALVAHGGQMKLNAFQAQNLAYQLNDVVVSVASGQNPFRVLLQQGSQITPIFGGVRGTMAALAGVLTPVTVGVGALTAGLVVGATALQSYLSSTKAVETAAAGLGRSVAGSAAEMELAAQSGANAANISIKQARAMEAEFLRSGKIGSDVYGQLIGLSQDFAATMGISGDEAGAALAELFADPAKAAEKLYRQYGLIDGATARYVENLAAQNRVQQAQQVLVDALPAKLAKATQATTLLGRAWQDVTTAASNAYDAIGNAIGKIGDTSIEARIKVLEAQLAGQASWDRAGQNLGINGAHTSPATDAARQELNQLYFMRRNREEDAARVRAYNAAVARGATAAGLAEGNPANQAAATRLKLENDLAALNAGANAPGLADQDRDNIARALDATKRALSTLIPEEQKQAQLDALDIQIQNERNPLIKANLAAERERVALSGQKVASAQAETKIEEARNKVLASTIAAARQQAADMASEAEIRRKVTSAVLAGTVAQADANAMLQEELTLRPLVAAAASAEGEEKQKLLQTIADLRKGYGDLAAARREASAADYIRSQDEAIAKAKVELALVGAAAAQRKQALAVYDAEAEIRKRGLETGSQEAAQIRANAAAEAQLNAEVERQTKAFDDVRQAGSGAIDSIVGKLGDGVTDIGDLFGDAAKEIEKQFLQMALANPLKNAAYGAGLPTLSDVGGAGGFFRTLIGVAGGGLGPRGTETNPMVVRLQGAGGSGGLVDAAMKLITGGQPDTGSDPWAGLRDAIAGKAPVIPVTRAPLAPANDNLSLYGNAIKAVESSGGNYAALGPLTATGDRAYGAYQVMGANIPAWTKQALGYSMSPSAFLADHGAQDAVFSKIFGGYLTKFGNASDAASAWFTGRPMAGGSNATDILGTTGSAYVEKFNDALKDLTSTTARAGGGLTFLGKTSVPSLADATGAATQGLGKFGSNLSNFFPKAPAAPSGGGIGNWLGGLFGHTYSAWDFSGSAQVANVIATGAPGMYDVGGYTGPGHPSKIAGFVHGQEYVFDAPSTRAIGVSKLEAIRRQALRGYQGGGYVSPSRPALYAPPGNQNSPSVVLNIQNHGEPVQKENVKQQQDANGNLTIDAVVRPIVRDETLTSGRRTNRELMQMGLKPAMVTR